MKVTCPKCRETMAAENIALDTGWGKCARCNEVFQLAEILPGYKAGESLEPVPERPFDARAIVERTEEKLMVHIPPDGMRAPYWGLLVFAAFWLGFVAFWTAGALGLLWGGGKGRIDPGRTIFACFSIPFWAAGFVMLGTVVWKSRGSRTVCLTASWMVTEKRCLFWRRRKRFARSLVQCARKGVGLARSWGVRYSRYSDVEAIMPSFSVELVYEHGTFWLPSSTEAEQHWLVAEINDFLKSVPYAAPTPLDEYVEQDPFVRR